MVLSLIPIVALSFSPIVGITTLKIAEPLTVTSVTISPAGVCTTTTFSFTCTVTMFAGDSGTVSVSIMNGSNTPILATLSSNSSNPEVTIVNPAPTALPSGVATAVLFTFSLLQSATPDTTTLTFTVTR